MGKNMFGRGGKAKPKSPKAKPAAKAKKPTETKKTAEQMSDQQRQELTLHHRRKLKPLIEAFKFADAAKKKGFELAKKDGITQKDILLAIQLETEEGQKKLQAEIQAKLDIDRYVRGGVGTQLNLFEKENSKERCFEDGRLAALDDKPARPPDHLSQQAANHWLEGHADGMAQLTRKRAEGFKPLGAVVGSIGGSGAAAVDSLTEGDREAA